MGVVSGERGKLARGIILSLVLGTSLCLPNIAGATQNIEVKTGTDVHSDAGVKLTYPHNDIFNPQENYIITIAPNISASGVIAADCSDTTFRFEGNSITTTGSGATNVDAIYASKGGLTFAEGSNVYYYEAVINIAATNSAIGAEAVEVSRIGLIDLGKNFTVTGIGSGSAIGASATGNGTTIVISGTDVDKITTVNGNAYGLYAKDTASISFDIDSSNVTKDIKVIASGSGVARALRAENGGKNEVIDATDIYAESATGNVFAVQATGKNSLNDMRLKGNITAKVTTGATVAEAIQAIDSGTNSIVDVKDITAYNKKGTAFGILATTGGKNSINRVTDKDLGNLSVTSDDGSAVGIFAITGASKNEVYGLKNVTVTGTTEAVGIVAAKGTDATAQATNTVGMDGDLKVTATGAGHATGVSAEQGYGTNTITGVKNIDVEATAADSQQADGIAASEHGTNNVNAGVTTDMGSLTVYTKNGTVASGITAYTGSTNNVGGLTNITVTTDGGVDSNATGIYAMGKSGSTTDGSTNTVLMNGDLTVKGNGTDVGATGIKANYSSTNTVTGVKNIDVETVNTEKPSGGLTGISAKNYGINNINNGATTVMGTLTVKTKTAETGKDTAMAEGVESLDNGTNNIGGLGDINVEVTGTGDAVGIYGSTSSINNINTTATSKMGTLTVKTASGNAAGVGAAESSTNNVAGLGAITVNSTGMAYGILAGSSSTNNVNKIGDTGRGDITVTSTDKMAVGVMARDSKNTVYGYDNIIVNGATKAYGVGAEESGAVNTIVMNGQVSATGGDSDTIGVYAISGSKDTITGVTAINATSIGKGQVSGIEANDGIVNVYQADGSSAVPVTATSTAAGSAYGVIAANNGTVTNVSDVTVKSNTGDAAGVVLGDGTNTVTTLNNIKVTSTGGDVSGIGTIGSTGTNTLAVAGNIEATTGDDYSLAYGIKNTRNSSLTVNVAGNVTTSSPAGTAGIVNSDMNGGTTDVTVQGNMTATGNSAVLAIAESGSTLTLTGGGTATLQATNVAMVAEVSDQSTINLKNITAKAEGPADGSNGIVSEYKGGTVNLINTKITGNGANGAADSYYLNVGSAATDNLNINIDKSSSLTGAVIAPTDSASLGSININNAGTWNVTGNSNLNASGTSSITNTGTIDMSKDGTTNSSLVSSTIKVKSLNNSGNIVMDVNPTDASSGDRIITTTASGNGTVTANIPAALVDSTYKDYLESESTPLIQVTGSNSSNYTVDNNGDNKLELGNWTYKLVTYTMPDGSIGYRLANSNTMSNKGKTILGSLVSPDYWYYETNALYADLPNFTSARTDKDVWAHFVRNKVTISNSDFDSVGASDIDTNYNGVVAGIDKKLSDNDKGTLWAGLMVGYGKGSNDFTGGNADSDSGHVGLYTVYKSKADWYVAGILKYNRYGTEIETSTSGGTAGGDHFSDKLNQNGYGISVLGGKRFKTNKGWYVEPQLEMGLHRINSGSYDLGGTHAEVEAMTSKRVRAGINFGKSMTYKSGANLDVFAQASLVHEFGGDYTINTSNRYGSGTDSLDVDYGGSWGLYKLGVDYSEPRGNSFGFALTYNKGGHRSSPLGVELTYNWAF